MKKLSLMLVLTAAVSMSGCATVFSKSSYPVAVQSAPAGAHFVIKNRAGAEIHNGTTPQTVQLKASAGFFKKEEYKITFTKPGYKPHTFTLKAGLDGWYLGDVLFSFTGAGLIGLLIVDPATGAMWSLPSEVAVTLDANPSVSLNTPDKQLNIVSIEQLNAEQRKHLVRVN